MSSVYVDWLNNQSTLKLKENSASCWFLLHGFEQPICYNKKKCEHVRRLEKEGQLRLVWN